MPDKVNLVLTEDKDVLVIVVNSKPSPSDPAQQVQSTSTSFFVVDQGYRGVSLVEIKGSVINYPGKVTNEEELSDLYVKRLKSCDV